MLCVHVQYTCIVHVLVHIYSMYIEHVHLPVRTCIFMFSIHVYMYSVHVLIHIYSMYIVYIEHVQLLVRFLMFSIHVHVQVHF